jgi:hypothetical protein
MSPTTTVNMFNLNPLFNEIGEVIEKGLNKILAEYMYRYELLENTHKQIMRLPSIRQELNKHPYDLYSDDENEKENDEKIICKNNNQYDKFKVDSLEYRLEKLEKKYDTMIPVLDKILDKIIRIDQEVKSLKSCENISPIKPSTHKPSEKENIKIHFEEPSEELVESDEEDLNPALITCSTIMLNKESVKVEEKVEEEEEDDELSVGEELGEHEEPKVEVKIPATLYRIVPAEELFPDEGLEADVEEESEEDEEDYESEAKTDNKLSGDVEAKSHCTVEAVVEGDLEEEASIETETKSETEEEEEDEEDLEEELVKEAEIVRELAQEKPPTEEEEDYELFEIEIDDKTYCTNDEENGFIWELTEDGEQGEKIGYLKDGDAFFYEDEN